MYNKEKFEMSELEIKIKQKEEELVKLITELNLTKLRLVEKVLQDLINKDFMLALYFSHTKRIFTVKGVNADESDSYLSEKDYIPRFTVTCSDGKIFYVKITDLRILKNSGLEFIKY